VRGCSRVSPGCQHCYAEGIAAGRGRANKGKPFHGFAVMKSDGPHWTGKVELIEDKLLEPLHWRKPRRVFVNSMSDLFHEELSRKVILSIWDVMRRCPKHTFQILTKRGEGMKEAFETFLSDDPLPNVWLGVSVEDQQRADERIPLLLQTPAAVRFLSVEPLLGPVDLRRVRPRADLGLDALSGDRFIIDGPGRSRFIWSDDHSHVDWVIVGGESGPGARPCDLAWIRSIRDQCQAAGVPAFIKQLGAKPLHEVESDSSDPAAIIDPDGGGWFRTERLKLKDSKGGSMEEWPADIRVREYPRQ
jgi:protein gp37